MNRKLLFGIARNELATLFFSPVAWLLLIVFACQVGIDFSDILTAITKIKALGNTITFSATAGVVLGFQGIYEVIQPTIYLYIPLLTMNLMSREYASGSIKLLYSSPVSSFQIIGGKFLAMVFIALLFVVILALPLITMAVVIPHVDIPLVLAGLLSMFLLILTYCAIGLFMSTLTSYQVVAAVATLSALAFFNYVGQIGQSSPLIRDITYWLSIKGRASEMVGGLICSDDVIYFLSVILLFLWFSVIKLDNTRTHRSLRGKAARYAAALLTVIAIGYVSSRPAVMTFYDATYAKQRTLSEESQQVMKQLDGPLTITTYVDIFDPEFDVASPRAQKEDFARFKMYTRFKPEIRMEYVYYYSAPRDSVLYRQYPGMSVEEIAREVARKKKCNPRRLVSAESLKERIDLKAEGYRFVRVVERGSGEQARLRLFDDMDHHPSETEISAALKKMIVEPVKVGVLTGHYERSTIRKGDQDYSIFATRGRFRQSMINQGFDVVEVDLSDGKTIPEEIGILMIAEARVPLSDEEMAEIDRFVARGGNLMILADTGRQEAMNPLVERFGVRLADGILAQPSDTNPCNLITSRATREAAEQMKGFYRSMARYPKRAAVTMPGAVALEVIDTTRFRPLVLLRTDSTAWIERQTTNFIDETPAPDSLAGERRGCYPTAIALTRQLGEKQQRILLLGDADCISNSELTAGERPGIRSYNFSLIPGSFRWLCYGEFPVSAAREPNRDTDILLTPMGLPLVKQIYCFWIPLLIGICGVVVWLRRRRG